MDAATRGSLSDCDAAYLNAVKWANIICYVGMGVSVVGGFVSDGYGWLVGIGGSYLYQQAALQQAYEAYLICAAGAGGSGPLLPNYAN